jgi:hypothetical protein
MCSAISVAWILLRREAAGRRRRCECRCECRCERRRECRRMRATAARATQRRKATSSVEAAEV